MPRDITTDFRNQKNSRENEPVHLVTVFDYDGSSNDLNFAESDADVTFDGVTYTKFPLQYDAIGQNSSGEIDRVKLVLANVSRLIGGYLEVYDLRGKKVRIRTVWLDDLADTNNYLDEILYIDKYTIDEKSAVFELTGKLDLLDVQIPLRRYSRNFCPWTFKSAECGYAGAATTCNKTKQRCKELGNFLRFGGCPSVRGNKVFLG